MRFIVSMKCNKRQLNKKACAVVLEPRVFSTLVALSMCALVPSGYPLIDRLFAEGPLSRIDHHLLIELPTALHNVLPDVN